MLDGGFVGVAIEDDADACSVRMDVEIIKVVQHVDEAAAEFDGFGGGKIGAGTEDIDIAADGGGRGDTAELGEDVRITKVACVQDVIHACKHWKKFGTEETVGVG